MGLSGEARPAHVKAQLPREIGQEQSRSHLWRPARILSNPRSSPQPSSCRPLDFLLGVLLQFVEALRPIPAESHFSHAHQSAVNGLMRFRLNVETHRSMRKSRQRCRGVGRGSLA